MYYVYHYWYAIGMKTPILNVYFYATELGQEPVRQWLKQLPHSDKRAIGEDIKTIQFGWPLGMPLVRHIGNGVWEVRCKLRNGIARVLFVMEGNSMVLIHGFIKKDQKIPKADLDLAKDRVQHLRGRL
jgi:phage-related protein